MRVKISVAGVPVDNEPEGPAQSLLSLNALDLALVPMLESVGSAPDLERSSTADEATTPANSGKFERNRDVEVSPADSFSDTWVEDLPVSAQLIYPQALYGHPCSCLLRASTSACCMCIHKAYVSLFACKHTSTDRQMLWST